MKKWISAFLVLFIAGEFHAIAENTAPSATDTDKAAVPEKETIPPAKPRKDVKSNLFYGGYINLSFGDYSVIGIEPMVGYKLTPKLSTGVKVRYDYIEDRRYSQTRTTSTYGGSLFTRYVVARTLYAHIEPASYNYELYHLNGSSEREWVPFLFVGAGYIQPVSDRTWLNVQILFDVLNDKNSPYDEWIPFFSIGVGVGF